MKSPTPHIPQSKRAMILITLSLLQSTTITAFTIPRTPRISIYLYNIKTDFMEPGRPTIPYRTRLSSPPSRPPSTPYAKQHRALSWSDIKNGLYSAFDALFVLHNQRQQPTTTTTSSMPTSSSSVAVEYQNSLESSLFRKESPGERLMREYELNKQQRQTQTPLREVPEQQQPRIDTPGERLMRQYQSLESAKQESVASGIPMQAPIAEFQTVRFQKQSLFPKPSSGQSEMKRFTSLLSSPNRLTRLKAELALRSMEWKQSRRVKRQNRERMFRETKKGVYETVDALSKGADIVMHFPETVVDGTRATTSQLQAVPMETERKVKELRHTFEEAVDKAHYLVDDVKALPETIHTSLDMVQTETIHAAEQIENVVKSANYELKFATGVEKRPVPPEYPPDRCPPLPTSSREVALKKAGSVFKTAWSAGRVAVNFGWKAFKTWWKASPEPQELKKQMTNDGVVNLKQDKNVAAEHLYEDLVKLSATLDFKDPNTISKPVPEQDDNIHKESAEKVERINKAFQRIKVEKQDVFNPSDRIFAIG